MYIISIIEDGESYDYEYSNINHANEHYNNESTATMYEYVEGKHYYIKSK